MTDQIFKKILTARLSPENGCFVANGTPLTVEPKRDTSMRRDTRYHFVSTGDTKAKSRFGWVTVVDQLTLGEFAARYLNRCFKSPEESAHVFTMLQAIAPLEPGKPVGCHYAVRGVESKRIEFVVHRVIFHR